MVAPPQKREKRPDREEDVRLNNHAVIKQRGNNHTHDEHVEMQVGLDAIQQCSADEVEKTCRGMHKKSRDVMPLPDQYQVYGRSHQERAVHDHSPRLIEVKVKRRIATDNYK